MFLERLFFRRGKIIISPPPARAPIGEDNFSHRKNRSKKNIIQELLKKYVQKISNHAPPLVH